MQDAREEFWLKVGMGASLGLVAVSFSLQSIVFVAAHTQEILKWIAR